MPTSRHPLVGVIDAGQWDAEAPLGRIILVAHAAFLNAGFIPCGNQPSRRVPTQVGLTSSTLSLRYTIPELVNPRDAAAADDTAVLRLCAHGRFLILYGFLTGDGGRRPSTRWACVDTLSVAPVLAGDMAAATRALAGDDAVGVDLWKALAEGLGRRLFVDICWKNAALLPPRFLSLPADLMASVLRRLAGVDLAMVECTCTELRDLVAERELWKAMYKVDYYWSPFFVHVSEILGPCCGWKEKYVMATTPRRPPWPGSRRWRLFQQDIRFLLRLGDYSHYLCFRSFKKNYQRFRLVMVRKRELHRCKRLDPTEHLIRLFKQGKSEAPVGARDGRRHTTAVHGNGHKHCGKKAIYSASARYGRIHR
ncbi:unnamed protein product [Urochloa humidicola]